VLAAAGLRRLDRGERISAFLPVEICVPAPGQGIIAIEIREDDAHAADAVSTIGDSKAAVALNAERAVVERLGGGCQMPIGAFAQIAGGTELSMVAIVVSTDGSRAVRADVRGSLDTPEDVGRQAADELLAKGADGILADARRTLAGTESHHP
jgi:hydroxymethylbilane synthase